jgi:hypothetical protein
VSKKRLAQISRLANGGSIHEIDPITFSVLDWERFSVDLDPEIKQFCQSNSDAEELHAFASAWNWDLGTWALELIFKNPACEAATALLIYWKSCPEYLLQYADRQEAEAKAEHQLANFDFLNEIEARYIAGEFRVGSIAFDPANPFDGPSFVGMYDDMRDSFVRELPAVMYAAVGVAARNADRPGSQ